MKTKTIVSRAVLMRIESGGWLPGLNACSTTHHTILRYVIWPLYAAVSSSENGPLMTQEYLHRVMRIKWINTHKTLRAVTGHNKSSILGCILITVIFLSLLSTSPEVIAHTQSPGLVKLLLQKTLSQNLIETLGKLILLSLKGFP